MGQKTSKPQSMKQPTADTAPFPTDETADTNVTVPDGFRWIDGRGYKDMGNPVYMLPNDGSELDRLNGQHYQFRFLLQGNYHVPLTEELTKGINVLDVGAGTGIWSVEMAQQFPNSKLTGTDIVNIFEATKAPSNCTFLVHNTLEGLPFKDGTFDYVFQRLQSIAFSPAQWPLVIKELIRVTKPGGYIELVESAQIIHAAGPCTAKIMDQLGQTLEMRGVDFRFVTQLDPLLKEAGLTNVTHDYRSAPGGWGPDEELGRIIKWNLTTVLKALKPQMAIALGLDEAVFDQLIEGTETEMGVTHKPYFNIEIYTAQKSF